MHLSPPPDPHPALCGALLRPVQQGRRGGGGDGGAGGDGPLRVRDLPAFPGKGNQPEERQVEEPGEGGAPCVPLPPGDPTFPKFCHFDVSYISSHIS